MDVRENFRADYVARIERNRTTKRQVLEWFGQPQDIARKRASSNQAGSQTEYYFGLFSDPQLIDDNSIVYYYRNERRTRTDTEFLVLVPAPGGGAIGSTGTVRGTPSSTDQHLWILLNERTGLVHDYIVKAAGDR